MKEIKYFASYAFVLKEASQVSFGNGMVTMDTPLTDKGVLLAMQESVRNQLAQAGTECESLAILNWRRFEQED